MDIVETLKFLLSYAQKHGDVHDVASAGALLANIDKPPVKGEVSVVGIGAEFDALITDAISRAIEANCIPSLNKWGISAHDSLAKPTSGVGHTPVDDGDDFEGPIVGVDI